MTSATRERDLSISIYESFNDVVVSKSTVTRWLYNTTEQSVFEKNLQNSLSCIEELGYDEHHALNGYEMTRDQFLTELKEHQHTELSIIVMPKKLQAFLIPKTFSTIRYQERQQVIFIANYICPILNSVGPELVMCE